MCIAESNVHSNFCPFVVFFPMSPPKEHYQGRNLRGGTALGLWGCVLGHLLSFSFVSPQPLGPFWLILRFPLCSLSTLGPVLVHLQLFLPRNQKSEIHLLPWLPSSCGVAAPFQNLSWDPPPVGVCGVEGLLVRFPISEF